jgi:hypothetical protein
MKLKILLITLMLTIKSFSQFQVTSQVIFTNFIGDLKNHNKNMIGVEIGLGYSVNNHLELLLKPALYSSILSTNFDTDSGSDIIKSIDLCGNYFFTEKRIRPFASFSIVHSSRSFSDNMTKGFSFKPGFGFDLEKKYYIQISFQIGGTAEYSVEKLNVSKGLLEKFTKEAPLTMINFGIGYRFYDRHKHDRKTIEKQEEKLKKLNLLE